MKNQLRILIATLLLFTFQVQIWAQGTSNRGTDFWLMYGSHVAGYSSNQNSWQKMALYLTSDVSTTGTIEIPGIGYNVPFSVNANQVTTVQIPQAAYIGGAEGKFNKGINIKSVKPIVAYAHIYDQSVSGATLVLPTNTLGKDYFSLNFTQRSNSLNSYSFCSIVAVEDNTEVLINPSVDTQGGLVAGVETKITLNRGEVYQLLSLETGRNSSGTTYSTGGDLTGTTIKSIAGSGQSCKKIAVFSGSTKMGIDCRLGGTPGSSDNLFQQVYPTATWGKSFVTVPSKNRNYDIYRVFKSAPDAVVKLNGVIIPSANFINNFYYEFSSQKTNNIESDKSIQIAQYQVTQGRSITCLNLPEDVGDPEMIFLNPLEQTLNKITMYSTSDFKILRHYVNVVIKTSSVASFTIDGQSKANEFTSVSDKVGYSSAQIEVSQGTHTLLADGGFNATAYGFGLAESYGYAAGASLISEGIEVSDTRNNLPKELGCLREGYNLFVSLPYQPLSVVVNFDDGNGDRIAQLTAPQEFISNDIKYYKYKLFTDIAFAVAKKYLIKLTAEKPTLDGCGAVELLELEYEVLKDPEALFDITENVCEGVATTFTDKSNAFGNSVVKWHWDYGNGQTEVRTSATPFTRNFAPGVYEVKLFVENEAGCLSAVTTKTIKVNKLPAPDFSSSTILCEKQPIAFTNQSTAVDGPIERWLWEFGDSTSSTDENPMHSYARSGTYNVKLTVSTLQGCEKSTTKIIDVKPLPSVDFKLPNFCLADGIATFQNLSTIPDDEQLTYLWNFGDVNANAQRPNTSTERDGKHLYTSTGVYEITLTVKSASGCETSLKRQFVVNGSIPKAVFEIIQSNALCSNAEISFRDLSTVDFGEITRIEWFFDSEKSITPDIVDEQPNARVDVAKLYKFKYPTFTDVASKVFEVKMKVYSGGSCLSEAIKSITIYPNAVPNFVLKNACLTDGKAQFDNLTTYVDPSIPLTFLWDFGDDLSSSQNPNTSNAKTPFHNYTRAGKYTVSLTVTTPFGCAATLKQDVIVNGAAPVANFEMKNAANLCVQTPVLFEDKTTLAFGEITRIDWFYDFANNPTQVVTDNNPGPRTAPKVYQHQYPIFNFPFIKTYLVRMVAYAGDVCVDQKELSITVNAQPTVDVGQPITVCQEVPSITLVAAEKNNMPGTGVFTGKGINSKGVFIPVRAGAGEHIITYTYTATTGCSVAETQTVTVNETPVIDAGEDKAVPEGEQTTLNATAFGKNLTYKWFPATGLDRDDILNPTVTPKQDIIYTLTVTSAAGCFAVDEVQVKFLNILAPPTAISPNGDSFNDVWNIKYIEKYTNVKVEIFDRVGQRVFFSRGYHMPFDGRVEGKDLPVGTYYYIITPDGKRKPLSGTLTIIR